MKETYCASICETTVLEGRRGRISKALEPGRRGASIVVEEKRGLPVLWIVDVDKVAVESSRAREHQQQVCMAKCVL